MFDKRKHVRMKDDLGIAVSVAGSTGVPERRLGNIVVLTKDISKGGLQFQHDRELPVGSKLRIHVALKFPLRTITHMARVRWTGADATAQRRAIGVEFVETQNTDMWDWLEHLDHTLQASST